MIGKVIPFWNTEDVLTYPKGRKLVRENRKSKMFANDGASTGGQERDVSGGMPLVSGDFEIQMYSAKFSCGNAS